MEEVPTAVAIVAALQESPADRPFPMTRLRSTACRDFTFFSSFASLVLLFLPATIHQFSLSSSLLRKPLKWNNTRLLSAYIIQSIQRNQTKNVSTFTLFMQLTRLSNSRTQASITSSICSLHSISELIRHSYPWDTYDFFNRILYQSHTMNHRTRSRLRTFHFFQNPCG